MIVEQVVEQSRQKVLTHHPNQQLKNLCNNNGLKEIKQIRKGQYE